MKSLLNIILVVLFSQTVIAQTATSAFEVGGSYLGFPNTPTFDNFYGGRLGFDGSVGKHVTLGISGGYHIGTIGTKSNTLESTLLRFSPELKYYFGNLFEGFYMGISLPSFNAIGLTNAFGGGNLIGFSGSLGTTFIDEEKSYAALSVGFGRFVPTQTNNKGTQAVYQVSASVIWGFKSSKRTRSID